MSLLCAFLLLGVNTVSFSVPYMIVALAVGAAVFFGIQLALKKKEEVDKFQEESGRAGAAALAIGFQHLDDLFFAIAGGSLKRIKDVVRSLRLTYGGEDGPAKLARDVVINCWSKIRLHPKYGEEVRAHVVATALGFDQADQKQDLNFAKAGGRLDAIGWSHSAAAAYAMGEKKVSVAVNEVVGLCKRVMEDNGEKDIAITVAPKTLAVLYNDVVYRDKIMPILRDYVQREDDRIASEDAKAMEKAKAQLAALQAKQQPAPQPQAAAPQPKAAAPVATA